MKKNEVAALTAIVSARLGALSMRARFLCLLGALAAAAIGVENASAQPNEDGVWSTLRSWPLIAVHTVMTPDGRVLTYGTKADGSQTGLFIYDVWDPSAGLAAGHTTFNNLTNTDLFCSSQVIMPHNGDILIAGGDNWNGTTTTNTPNNNTNIFDPGSNTLTRSANMNRQRWYSSATVLVNGDIYIQGGNGGADRPEVRQQNGTFRLLSNVDTNQYQPGFPRNFIAPDGRIFGYDFVGLMYYVNPSGTGSISQLDFFPSANAGSGSGQAMFRPGKILQFGGNSNGAIVIDINGPQPVITPTGSMSSQRFWVTGAVLPNGTVLATGGSRIDNELVDVNNSAEIWDPATGQWSAGSSGATPRLYHSNSLLLQDATVLINGGGAYGPVDNLNAEIYSPPYLFNSSGGAAARTQIVTAPTTADVGTALNITVDKTDVSRVTLVKTGSVTHSVNMEQRFVELPFAKSATLVTAQLPERASDTPPGFYQLFVLNAAGVPSRSRILQINIDTTPNTAVDYTPTMGGTGGTDYQLSCNADETLVGVYGRYQTLINQVGPQCARVDQFGHWIGNPVQRALTGTTTTGTLFNKVCPRDFAMSGFRGRSSTTVNQLEIECRALTAFGGLTGTGTFLGADGGTGGTVQPLQACGTANPVYAIYGRSASQIDSFGVLCRTAAITPISTGSAPVIVNPGTQTNVTGTVIDLAIQATDGDNDPLTFTAAGLPAGLSINATSGHVTGVPTTPGTTQAVVTVTDGTQSTFTVFNWTITGNALLTVAPMPAQPPRLAATPVTYTASASGGTNVRYKWNFDDGTPETAYSPSASVTHTFASPGIYFVTLTVNDDLNVASIQRFAQMIHLPLTPTKPRSSSSVAYETRPAASSRVWLANQDNDTVSVFDAVTNARSAEISVGAAPRGVAVAPDGRVWVVNRDAASISIVSPSTLAVVQTVALPRASQPYGIVFSPVVNQAFVALSATGRVLKLDATTGTQLASLDVGPEPRQLAVDGTGAKLYVSRFITPRQPGEETATVASQIGGVDTGGEVVVVDAANMLVMSTVVLRHSARPDSENQGSGVPNYLGAPAISPDGTIAIVPSKQDNIARGMLRNGVNLNFQNTVRAIASRIDLATGAELPARRIDLDNAGVASAVAFDPYGVYMFVSLETSREVAVVDVHDGVELFRFAVGRAPQSLAVSPSGDRLYVNNFMDRSVSVFDLTGLRDTGQWSVPLVGALPSVGTEKLSAAVLLGKQLFYDAKDQRLARDSYMSCASCHNDGGQDGRVWDLTGMGEGLRNTINLRGTAARHGRLHWTANFDEVQDFEGQIRALAGGTGLMSDTAFGTGTRNQPLGDPKAGVNGDLDALAAYVASLNAFAPSPYRTPAGALTPDATAGRTLFGSSGCATCHSGRPFTNSASNVLENVGTIKPSSGQRLGAPLTGLDTPTLCSAWQTAPYLHDGSATSIAGAISAHSGASFNASDLAQLAAYVLEIDAVTAPDCATAVPGLLAAYSFDEGAGTTVLDRTENQNNGSVQGGAIWTTQGKNGGALVFNGAGVRVQVSASPTLNPTNALTIEAWVFPTATQSGWRAVIQKEVDAWLLHASSGASLVPAAGGTYGGVGGLTVAPSAIPVNAWTHLAQTYDGSAIRLYVDGALVSSTPQTGVLETNSSPLSIGGTNAYGEYFNGRIDDVRVYDRALSPSEIASDMSTPAGTPSAGDVTPPTAPGTLTASAASATQVNLSWGAATDDVGVTGYRVERCAGAGCTTFTQIATPTGTTFNDTGLTASTPYSYRVRAVDEAGNPGAFSNTSSATTPAAADTTPPSAPGTLTATAASATQINLSWGAATDNVGVTGYRVERCAGAGCTTFAQIATPAGTTLNDTGLAAATSYSYRVRAVDAAGNTSAFGNTSTATTPAGGDTSPPSAPGALTASAASSTQINLSWGAATDNVGVTGYRVERCSGVGCTTFAQIATPTGTSFNDLGLTASTSYSYRVRAVDAAGNPGAFSNTSSATTQASADTAPPSAPGTLTANATSSSQVNLSWGAATDNVEVTGYRVERCSGAGCTTFAQIATPTGTTFNDLGLTASTSYSYRVRAVDAAANTGAFSNTASATTSATNVIPGLLAAYSFDEGTGTTVVDRSGHTNTGTVQGTVAWTTSGKNSGALVFNGAGTRVQIPAATGLNPTNALTLEAWVFPTVAQNGWRAIIQKEVDAWFLHASSGATLFPAAGGTYGGAGGLTLSPSAIPDNAWTHLATTYDGATIRLYVNGALVASTAQTGALETNNSPLSIGGTNAYGEFFEGRIDDVRVYDRVLSTSELTADMNTAVGTPTGSDTTPPSAPGTLTASAASATQIDLSWGAATDDVGVTGYLVERCSGAGCTTFTQIATQAGTSFNDSGLTAATSYSYRVRAADAAGNSGAFSNTGTATTQTAPDTTPPGAPGTLTASAVSATQVNLTWGAATDDVGVTGYRVERCSGTGCASFTQIATPAGTSFSDTGLTDSTSYSYRVRAVDAAGNLGSFSNTSSAATPDTTPPGAPGTLTASAASATQINLSWGAATDNVGVTGYRVERCAGAGCTTFTQIATPTGTSFGDTGLTGSTSYSYRVRAVDAAANPGSFSNTGSATTLDTTPPSAPGTLTATASSATQIDLSWGAATDNIGVTGYRVERCTGAGCTSFSQIAGITGTTFSDPGLAAATPYSYRVRAVDGAGNTGAFSNTSSATTLDTTPPSAPGTLTASSISPTQVDLSWGAATDNVGVTGYRVERCSGAGCATFAQIATPTGTSFSDTGLTATTAYSYRVRAVDAAGNLGAFGNTSSVTTQTAPDTTPPGAPGALTASAASATQINLSWGAATDDVGVTGYRVERCSGAGCASFAQIATPSGTSFNDTGLTASTSYSYRVRAVDAAGNPGPFGNTSTAATPAAPDTTPPGAPGTLTASAVSATQINLAWGAATDDVGVTGYRVERCSGAGCTTFTQVGAPTGTSFNDTGLTGATSYSYRVRAVDAAGNPGPFSNTGSATTLDTTPPSAPGTLTAAAASSTQVNLSWGAATDNVGVTGYRVERCSGAGCSSFTQIATPTGTTFNDTGLTDSTSYSYRVRAVDAAGNPGAFSNTSGATTADATPPGVPGTLTASAVSSTQINLSWGAATDNVGVTGYRVERCSGAGCTSFAQIATPTGTTFNDTGLTGSTSYSYRVRAVDAAANLGSFSNTSSATTADATPPSAPGTLTATTASATQINLSWGAATDNVGVTGYRVERCSGASCTTFTQIATPTGTTFNDTGLTGSTSYSYRVRAVDAAANPGPFSNTSSATTADGTPPGAPGTLTTTAASSTQINLSWGAATDNVGVTGYRVERCSGAGCTTFAQIATPAGTTLNDTGLAAATSYSYRVRAVDAAGNLGSFSNTSTAATQAAADTTPPSAPGALTAGATSATQIDLSWGAATDNVGVTGYRVERCSGAGCTTFAQIATPTGTSFNDLGLTASTSYSYRVRAVDAAGNLGAFSSTSTTATQAAPDTTPPGVPATLTATAASSTQVDLTWGAATDDVGVTGYRVERCAGAGCTTFAQIATPTGTSFNDSGLTASTSYSYRVRAVDAAANTSAFSNTASATTSAASAVPGLLAAYSFDEGAGTTVVDRSGNTNTGTVHGTVAWTTAGKNGGALTFNGTSTRVEIAASTSLNPTNAVTVEAWVYPTVAQGGWRAVVQKEVDAWLLHASYGGGDLYPAAGGTYGGVGGLAGASSAIPVDAWSHLATTYDGETIRLYVNGALVASSPQTGALETNNSPLSIGGTNAYGEFFEGRIDDVRVYDRALSESEIATDLSTPAGN